MCGQLASSLIKKIKNMTYQFKIQILKINNPPVWRRVIVPDTYTFEQFHKIIQVVLGWTDSHSYLFSPEGYGSYPLITVPSEIPFEPTEDVATTYLKEIFNTEQQTFIYIYDFGDNWIHKITLEAKLPDFSCFSPIALYIAGEGKCPPEDCGGTLRYRLIKEILSDHKHPEYKETIESIGLSFGKKWDADYFDIKTVRSFLHKNKINKAPIQLELFELSPHFNHAEVNLFYYISFNFDREKLQEIIALPRQTLIEDLCKMLHDCIERRQFFSRYETYMIAAARQRG